MQICLKVPFSLWSEKSAVKDVPFFLTMLPYGVTACARLLLHIISLRRNYTFLYHESNRKQPYLTHILFLLRINLSFLKLECSKMVNFPPKWNENGTQPTQIALTYAKIHLSLADSISSVAQLVWDKSLFCCIIC
jgi:hypothetical protein